MLREDWELDVALDLIECLPVHRNRLVSFSDPKANFHKYITVRK